MTTKEHARLVAKFNRLVDAVTDLGVLVNSIGVSLKAAAAKAKLAKPKTKSKAKTKPKPKQTAPKHRKNVTLENVFVKRAN